MRYTYITLDRKIKNSTIRILNNLQVVKGNEVSAFTNAPSVLDGINVTICDALCIDTSDTRDKNDLIALISKITLTPKRIVLFPSSYSKEFWEMLVEKFGVPVFRCNPKSGKIQLMHYKHNNDGAAKV